MSQRLSPEDLGQPDLKIMGFQLWIHGRQFPEADDYWDANWLRVSAHCGASGASIWVRGAIVMVTDIESFGKHCEAMMQGRANSATLDPLEPELSVALEAVDHLGHVSARVEITPDHLAQSHKVEFPIDQSYLPGIIKQCSDIVQEYPIRGDNPPEGV